MVAGKYLAGVRKETGLLSTWAITFEKDYGNTNLIMYK